MTTRTIAAGCRRGLCFALLLSAWAGAADKDHATPKYGLQAGESRSYRATFTADWHTPAFTADDWIGFVAYPPLLPGRQSGVNLKTSPKGQLYPELSPAGRQLIRMRQPASDAYHRTHQRFEAIYEYTLTSRLLVERQAGGKYLAAPPLSHHERTIALAADESIDFKSSEFQNWLTKHKLQRRSRDDDMTFALRAYRRIAESLEFEREHSGMKRETSHVCRVGKSDCSGLSNMFVGALRNAGIPSRILVGFWSKSKVPAHDGKLELTRHHVVAEFYVPDVGWVPVDMYAGVVAEEGKKMREFGKNDASFFTMHFDRYLIVDSVFFGQKTLTGLQGMKGYVRGKGSLQGNVWTENWVVTPIEKR